VSRASNIVFTILALTCIATAADAHTRSESYSHWYLSGSTITGTVTIPLREVMLLYQDADSNIPPRDLFRDVLTEHTIIRSENNPCTRQSVNILQAASGFVRVEMQFDCSPGIPSAIYYRALFDTAPGHVHYAKLHRDGNLLAEQLITDTADTWDISNVDATIDSYSFVSFLTIGAKHITGGLDHIAFLLGLLLISGSIRRSIIAVTGFTLGHSISLAAAVLGYVHADGQLVEAFIGFTVALVAVEYFLAQRQTVARYAFSSMALAWLIGAAALALDLLTTRALLAYLGIGLFAFCYLLAARDLARRGDTRVSALLFVATTCFGLVHGFGFAGFLMETGILGTSLFVPLLGFNLGVEIGQLILVVAALAAASLLRNRLPDSAAPMLAAGLCGIGIFWFVGRTFA
jgi:hypothetical protein